MDIEAFTWLATSRKLTVTAARLSCRCGQPHNMHGNGGGDNRSVHRPSNQDESGQRSLGQLLPSRWHAVRVDKDIPLYGNQLGNESSAGAIYQRLKSEMHPQQKLFQENSATLHALGARLDILGRFAAFAGSLKAVDESLTNESAPGYFLLQIDVKQAQLTSQFFDEQHFDQGAAAYVASEKATASSPAQIVALVSTDAVGGIKEAYPNYFADSSIFTRYVSASREAYRHHNPSGLSRFIERLRH